MRRDLSPSSINLFTDDVAAFVAKYCCGFKSSAGLDAFRGLIVEAAVCRALADGNVAAAGDRARTDWDRTTAFSWDKRRGAMRPTLERMIALAYDHLEEFGAPQTQVHVEITPQGNVSKIHGYADIHYPERDIVYDLKCCEKHPPGPRPSHIQQISFYAALLGARARLLYVSPEKAIMYDVSDDAAAATERFYKTARVVERFLALSDDPKFFTGITIPNLSSIHWSSPEARRFAEERWEL
jgi:hypothetical protein